MARQELEEKRNVITDLESKVSDLDDKWSKSKRINTQRKEKLDALEIQVENLKAATLEMDSMKKKLSETKSELEAKESKVSELERAQASAKKTWGSSSSTSNSQLQVENDDLKKQVEELKKKANNPVSRTREVQELRQELDKLQAERDDIKKEYETLKGELTALRSTYNAKSDDWIKEKLDFQHRMKDLEESIRCSAGEGWDSERERFKQIIDDRDNQITQLKIENDVARSQVCPKSCMTVAGLCILWKICQVGLAGCCGIVLIQIPCWTFSALVQTLFVSGELYCTGVLVNSYRTDILFKNSWTMPPRDTAAFYRSVLVASFCDLFEVLD